MPALVAVANPYQALTAQLRLSADVVALTSTRIGLEMQTSWLMPKQAIVVTQAGGVADVYPPLATARAAIRCFAPKYFHDAEALYERVLAWLLRPEGNGPTSFTLGGCVVHGVQHEGSIPRLADYEGKPWPSFLLYVVMTYSLVPS